MKTIHIDLDEIARRARAVTDAERSKEERLAIAKKVYEDKMRRASDPSARAEAKEDYEHIVKAIKAETGDADRHIGERELEAELRDLDRMRDKITDPDEIREWEKRVSTLQRQLAMIRSR